jgi:DNA-binding transcriptional ArsR family regulator
MEILDVLHTGPATSSQVAARMGVHPANLTRHLRTLLDAELIELVERRDTGRTVEKYYAPTAERFVVEPDVAALDEPQAIALGFAHSQLGAAVARLPEGAVGPITALSLAVRLTPAAAQAYARELTALAERFAAAEEPAGEPFEFVLALYPGTDPMSSRRRESVRLAPADTGDGPAAGEEPRADDTPTARPGRGNRPGTSRRIEGPS